MLSRLGKFLTEKNLVSEGDRILCMVSGGPDSVAMLHLLSLLARGGEPSFPTGFALGICHVNYVKRGEASYEDEDYVRSLGDRYNAPVHVITAPDEERSNFQAWARDYRYLAAENLCRWQGYNKIAVAHNLDDRVETFLYRMITYSGRRSLVVMPARRGKVIRPLLFLEASDIRGYLDAEGIEYKIDQSNLELEYARNQIRHKVTPELEKIRPDYRDRVTDTLSLLEDEALVLRNITSAAWREVLLIEDESGVTLSAGALAQQPRAVARLVVRRWLTGAAGIESRMSRRLLDAIVDLCRDSDGSRTLSLAGGLQVERQYDKLGIGTADRGDALTAVDLEVPGMVTFGDFEIEAVEAPDWDIISLDPYLVTLDAGTLKDELVVRSWQPGDSMSPLGLEGSKSLQDIFTDEKVPQMERGRIPIVTSGDGIVWVCGLRMSEEHRVHPGCKRMIGLRAARKGKGEKETIEERA